MGHMRAPCSAASDRRWHDFLHGANAARAAGLRCLPSARLRRLALILLLAFGCAGGLALVEVALRLHQWAQDGVRNQFVEDRSLLHHRLRANFDGVVRGVHFTTNSRGLRDREFAVPKPAGIFRIAILGDSFTEGSGLEDAEAMPKRLEQRVQRACGLGIEVVNAGVSSYSPILYYLHLKYVVAPLQPDLVVVNVDMGDVHEDMIRTEIASLDAHGLPIAVPANRRLELAQTLPPILPPALRGLEALMARLAVYQRLRLSSLGIWFFGHRRLELAGLERSGLVGDLRYDPLAVTRDVETEQTRRAWALTSRYIRGIQDVARSLGARFVLVTYPYAHQVSATASPAGRQAAGIPAQLFTSERPFEILEALGAQYGFPVINLLPLFRQRETQHGPLFRYDDIHHTAQGAEVFAEGVFIGLREHGLISCAG